MKTIIVLSFLMLSTTVIAGHLDNFTFTQMNGKKSAPQKVSVKILDDVKDPATGKVVLTKGTVIKGTQF